MMSLHDYPRQELEAAIERLSAQGVDLRELDSMVRPHVVEGELLRERAHQNYVANNHVVVVSAPGILGRTYDCFSEPLTREAAIERISEIRQNKRAPSTGLGQLDHYTGHVEHLPYAEWADELKVQVAKWFGGKGAEGII